MISKRHVFTVLEEKYRYDCKNAICRRRKLMQIDLLAVFVLLCLIKSLLSLCFLTRPNKKNMCVSCNRSDNLGRVGHEAHISFLLFFFFL